MRTITKSKRNRAILPGILVLVSAGAALARDANPKHDVPAAAPNGDLVVGLCDGKTTAVVNGVKQGQAVTPDQARAVSNELMGQWKKKNPTSHWDDEERIAQAGSGPLPAPAAAGQGPSLSPAPAGERAQSQAYGSFTKRDEEIWQASTDAFIEQGNKTFHDASALGGTIAVSCDMCHPNAANTHPETYPKFQVQLGKVALLRDMINWCIENPVRGKPLADDDPKLRAMEAYILAQRKGVALAYGKH
jgi:thiosulfate dehydrogenase